MAKILTEREAVDWMKVHGQDAPDMDFRVQMMTPGLAKQMLEGNTNNRRLRKNAVDNLAKAIKRGEWKLTHQAVAVTSDGRILDGQHRLSAVVAADEAVPMIVVHKADPKSFDSLDIGVRRTPEDIIGGDRQILQISTLLCRLIYTENDNSIQRVEHMHQIVSPLSTLICGGITKLNKVNMVGIRTGVVIRAMQGNQKYIADLWHALVDQMTETLPPVGHAFLRRINTPTPKRRTHRQESTNVCMGWEVANIKRKDSNRFGIGAIPQTLTEIRNVVRAYMEENPSGTISAVAPSPVEAELEFDSVD